MLIGRVLDVDDDVELHAHPAAVGQADVSRLLGGGYGGSDHLNKRRPFIRTHAGSR
jgi:hypothetical protein